MRKNYNDLLQAHMDKMDIDTILTEMTEEDMKQLSREPDRCEYAANLMSELSGLLRQTSDDINNLLKADSAFERSYIHQCWDKAAANIHFAEQLLWKICDASWYNRNDALNGLTKNTTQCAPNIELFFHESTTIIKCPYLAIYKANPYMLTEDLLMAKLTQSKNLPHYKSAHVSFIHVYSTDDASIPKDVGNYYYRRTIDLLAVFFGFSDSAQCYSMSMSAIFSDAIEGGTYIFIQNKENDPLTADFLSAHFPRKS